MYTLRGAFLTPKTLEELAFGFLLSRQSTTKLKQPESLPPKPKRLAPIDPSSIILSSPFHQHMFPFFLLYYPHFSSLKTVGMLVVKEKKKKKKGTTPRMMWGEKNLGTDDETFACY
jgi:hypothetical protein